MSKYNIELPVGIELLGVTGNIRVTADDLKEMLLIEAVWSDDEPNLDAVEGLVSVYVALVDEKDPPAYQRIVDWVEAEAIYREFAIKGLRWSVVNTRGYEGMTDDEIFELCDWYEFGERIRWPDQLIAEIGFVSGFKAGAGSKQLRNYAKRLKKEEATP